jgi:hypothetical protein
MVRIETGVTSFQERIAVTIQPIEIALPGHFVPGVGEG